MVEQPDRVARIRVAARVANVAQTCLRYVTAEFPKSSPLCLAGAFALPPSDQAPLVSGETNNRLRLLARLMKWEQPQEDALVAELNEAIGKAMTYQKKWDSSHLAAWDAAVEAGTNSGEWAVLREMVLFLHCFLISETQCERDFAKDVISTSAQRNRLSPKHRFNNIKMIADGPPVSYISQGDRPIGKFLERAQNAYAQLFGTRRLSRHKKRRDIGQSHSTKRKRKRERKGNTDGNGFQARARQGNA